ncbi:TonB-dependent receptor [Phenylobacterium sp.]|jgi:iron complex outermembrane receptor protein|uniref:TonB-dependent receptor plug domain-containing protein n=1 Tax=Phenylobacterium sp. TaxID=1871053 RepID=UPI002A3651BB|nr:TonB-dependent receptor [Phenylobacterium sp.]
MPAVRRRLAYGASLAVLALAGPACADDAMASLVDEVIVTGTSASDLTVRTSATPIDVVSAERIQQTGAADLGQVLQAQAPAVNFPSVTIGSAAGANLNATLRGLAPDQTLVLVNGRRQHKSAFVNVKGGTSRGNQAVDLATIPLSAIKRVEVLRDAAAARYGSDAIAGVINIVLRDEADGGNLTVRAGQYRDGDGQQAYVRLWKGFALPGDGFATFAIDAGHADDTDQFEAPETRAWYFPGDPREATVDKAKFYRGQPEIRTDVRAAFNAAGQLTDQLELYGFATTAFKRTRINGNPLLPRANETVRALYPDGAKPNQWVNSEDRTFGAGLRWEPEGLGEFDLSFTWGDNQQTYRTTKSNNASLGLATPTDFDTGSLYNQQTEVNLGWVTELPIDFGAGPLTFAAGVSGRREFFRIGAGETASWIDGGVPILDGPNAGRPAPYGSMTWQAYLPIDAGSLSRKVWGGYASVEGLITPDLRVSATGRAENYSDFGDVVTGETSARWELNDALALRGSVSTGVRAPSIGQVGYSYTQTTNVVNQTGLFQVRTFKVDTPVAIALGSAPLKPEKSVNLSAGVVWRIGSAASITLDAYQISIEERIALSDNFAGPEVEALLRAAGHPQAISANFFTNALDTRTRGLSLTADWATELFDGDLDLRLAGELNRTEVTKTRAINGRVPIGRQTAGYLEYGTPDIKLVLSGTWSRGPWRVNATGIHYGQYKQLDPVRPEKDQTFSSQQVVNASVAYELTEKVRLSVGADNLFSSTPDRVNQFYIDGGLANSSLNPVNRDGRFVWASLSFDF